MNSDTPAPPDRPELLIVSPTDPRQSLQLASRMVDQGVFFPFGTRYSLPQTLPDDIAGLKMIVIPRGKAESAADRLDTFREAGGLVTAMDAQDWEDLNLIERSRGKAGLTAMHPGMAAQMEAVPDRGVFEATLKLSLDYLRPEWHDVLRYNIECLAEAHALTGDEAILDHCGQLVTVALDARPPIPVSCDHVSCIYAILRYIELAEKPDLLETCRGVVGTYLARASRFRGVISNYARADEQGLLRAEVAFQFCPALARLSRHVDDPSYADFAVGQIAIMERELRDDETGLWYLGVGRGGRTPCLWARGCSFSFRGVVDTLAELEEDHPARSEMIDRVGRMAAALRRHQNGSGEWHQVMNEPWTRPEGSATAWTTAGFAKSMRHGWIDNSYRGAVELGWRAVKRRTWAGHSTRVCGGITGSMDPEYYRFRHFMGPSYGHFNLMAALEVMQLGRDGRP